MESTKNNELGPTLTADIVTEEGTSITLRDKEEVKKEYKNKSYKDVSEESFLGEKEKIIEQLKKYVNEEEERLNKKIKESEEKTGKNLKEIEKGRITMIEALGIFIALFTFISVDFQVFRTYRDPFAIAGLTIILLGAIGFLMSIFDFFILKVCSAEDKGRKADKEKYKNFFEGHRMGRIILFFLEIGLIISGIFLFSRAKIEEFEDRAAQIKNEVFEYTKNNLRNEMLDIEKEQFIIDDARDIKNELDLLKKCVTDFGFTYKCFK